MKENFDHQQQIQNNYWNQNKALRRGPEHIVVQSAFNPLANLVASSIENPIDSSVLDVGCGNGFLQWALENVLDLYQGSIILSKCLLSIRVKKST